MLSIRSLFFTAPGPRVALAFLLFVAVAGVAEAQIGVSPSRLEINLDDGPGTHAVRVLNEGTAAAELTVRVVHWDLDEGNEVRIIPPHEQSLDQWLVVNPLRFSLEPGSSQTVRFGVRPRVEPAPGEHRAMLFFEQQGDAGPSGIQVMFRLGVAVYGHAGQVTREAQLHGVESSPTGLAFDLSSLGTANARLRGEYILRPLGAVAESADPPEIRQPLPTTPVLPGTRRTVRAPFPRELPPGSYALTLDGRLGDDVLADERVVEIRARSIDGADSADSAGAP